MTTPNQSNTLARAGALAIAGILLASGAMAKQSFSQHNMQFKASPNKIRMICKKLDKPFVQARGHYSCDGAEFDCRGGSCRGTSFALTGKSLSEIDNPPGGDGGGEGGGR